MRILLKTGGICLAIFVLAVLGVFCWLRFYTRDLPDITGLAQFAPAAATQAHDSCLNVTVTAIPYEQFGTNLRLALNAAEVREKDTGVLSATLDGFVGKGTHRATLSWQTSRSIYCMPYKFFHRQLAELRTAEQLEHRYSQRQLFTIYANRAYFGDNAGGVQAAAQHFFGKDPNQLSIAEAALIAGLIKSPSLYSPTKHPDRALQRRNEVIDAMLANRTITDSDAQGAKSSKLGIVDERIATH